MENRYFCVAIITVSFCISFQNPDIETRWKRPGYENGEPFMQGWKNGRTRGRDIRDDCCCGELRSDIYSVLFTDIYYATLLVQVSGTEIVRSHDLTRAHYECAIWIYRRHEIKNNFVNNVYKSLWKNAYEYTSHFPIIIWLLILCVLINEYLLKLYISLYV